MEPETARVAEVLGRDGAPVGAGCLVSSTHLLTCEHVVRVANGAKADDSAGAKVGDSVEVVLIGVATQPRIAAKVVKLGGTEGGGFAGDLALLELTKGDAGRLAVRPVEFATPLVHNGKTFGVMGFPANDPDGIHASGVLRAPDRNGLVQMDGSPMIGVAPGFSGAPVWSHALRAFVGLVVADEGEGRTRGLAWCVPSRLLCRFVPELPVKFRIPPDDRPSINDREVDDPNADLFGTVSNNGERRLTAWVGDGEKLTLHARYEALKGAPPPRGAYVTFITYPDFKWAKEDAYELFERIDGRTAETYFYPKQGFTVAAIGDGGDTVLTLDLCSVKGAPKSFYQ
jgi:hypothetical protein